MRDNETLINGILDNTIAIKELTLDELDAVHEELCEIAEGMLDTDEHDLGVALIEALDANIDALVIANDESFEAAIVAAEARGSVYFEFEDHVIH